MFGEKPTGKWLNSHGSWFDAINHRDMELVSDLYEHR